MIKKRFISMLVLLCLTVSGAWAQEETLLTTILSTGDNASFKSGSKTFDNIATVTFSGNVMNDNDFWGWYSGEERTLTVTAAEGYTITRVKFYTDTSSAFDEDAPFEAILVYDDGNIAKVNGTSIGANGVTKIEVYGYAGTPEPATVAVTGVTLAPTSATLTLGETETVTLIPTVLPDDATDKSVTWSSSDEAVATVSNEGVVTAVAAGEATITVTTTDGAKTATCAVTVAAPAASTTYTLAAGDNWVSFNNDATLDDLKSALVAALPSVNGIVINSQSEGWAVLDNEQWRGSLGSLDATQMYMISVPSDCEITLEGMPVDPAEHSVTICNGFTWLGYQLSENMSPAYAFAGFAVNGDKVFSQEASTTCGGSRWRGSLSTLEPGKGYIYQSASSENRIFVFPAAASRALSGSWSSRKRVASHWPDFDFHQYQLNKPLVAAIKMDGEFATSSGSWSDLEVAAFVGDECRGRALLETGYGDPYPVIEMPVYYNNADETVTFKVYVNGTECELADASEIVTGESHVAYFNGSEPGLSLNFSTPASTYTVTLKEGTEDATNWQGKAGEGEYQALPLAGVEAGKALSVKYNGTKHVKSVKAKKKAAATPLDNTTTAWTAGTFAVPAGGLTYSAAITVSGDVTLVLTDGETLTLNKGISLASDATLTIEGTGTMNVKGSNSSTSSTTGGSGTITLTSGTLTATGGNGGDGWEDGTGAAGGAAINGSVIVDGGTLTAKGGNGGNVGYGILVSHGGAGGAAISGSVTVNGGTLTATGGNGGNVGDESYYGHGGAGGAAIGGSLTINAGTMTTTNGAAGSVGFDSDGCSGGSAGKAVAGTVTDKR